MSAAGGPAGPACLDEDMTEQTIDPAIVDAVQSVANRFGISGLEDLIAEAQRELREAQAAYAELAPEPAPEPAAETD